MEASSLALFWARVIALSILVYVLLDGFDLGVGILFGTTRDEMKRGQMMSAISPFWDGNETWLVVIGASLFAAFPPVYAVFLGAFYLPVLLMLIGLIFRGIAFEFRNHSRQLSWLWDHGFFYGSVLVAFVQGAAVGAMMRGIPTENGQYTGGAFTWLHPFPILTGIGLVLGYALLGAGWLVLKSDGAVRDWARERVRPLVIGVLVVLGLAFVITMTVDAGAIAQNNLDQRSWGIAFPAVGLLALVGVHFFARKDADSLPYGLTAVFFIAAFLTLGVMMWPYMIPYGLTVADAAAPEASLRFFSYAGFVALPIITIYTIGVYWVFRGKIGQPQS